VTRILGYPNVSLFSDIRVAPSENRDDVAGRCCRLPIQSKLAGAVTFSGRQSAHPARELATAARVAVRVKVQAACHLAFFPITRPITTAVAAAQFLTLSRFLDRETRRQLSSGRAQNAERDNRVARSRGRRRHVVRCILEVAVVCARNRNRARFLVSCSPRLKRRSTVFPIEPEGCAYSLRKHINEMIEYRGGRTREEAKDGYTLRA